MQIGEPIRSISIAPPEVPGEPSAAIPQYSAHTDANAGADTVVSLPYLTWPIVGYRLWQWDVQSLKSLTASAGCRAARFLCAARFPRLGCADPEDDQPTFHTACQSSAAHATSTRPRVSTISAALDIGSTARFMARSGFGDLLSSIKTDTALNSSIPRNCF